MKSVFCTFTLTLLIFQTKSFGQISDQAKSLRDILDFRVVVEEIGEEYRRDGFTRARFQTAVELRLRELGIQVVDDLKSQKSLNQPLIYVNVQPMRVDKSLYAISVEFYLIQIVGVFKGIYSKFFNAITWDEGGLLIVEKNNTIAVQNFIYEFIDMFANDYYRVNDRS